MLRGEVREKVTGVTEVTEVREKVTGALVRVLEMAPCLIKDDSTLYAICNMNNMIISVFTYLQLIGIC